MPDSSALPTDTSAEATAGVELVDEFSASESSSSGELTIAELSRVAPANEDARVPVMVTFRTSAGGNTPMAQLICCPVTVHGVCDGRRSP